MPAGISANTTKSYLVPIGDLSLGDRQKMRAHCDDVIVDLALTRAIKPAPEQLIVRDCLPNTDMGVAAPGGAALAAQESWLVPALAAVAAETQFFSIVVPVDRIIGFFGCAPETVPYVFSRLRITLGVTSQQARGVFQLEQLNARLEPVGYFSETVAFANSEVIRTMLMARAAAALNTQVFPLYARTCEAIGATVSAPSI